MRERLSAGCGYFLFLFFDDADGPAKHLQPEDAEDEEEKEWDADEPGGTGSYDWKSVKTENDDDHRQGKVEPEALSAFPEECGGDRRTEDGDELLCGFVFLLDAAESLPGEEDGLVGIEREQDVPDGEARGSKQRQEDGDQLRAVRLAQNGSEEGDVGEAEENGSDDPVVVLLEGKNQDLRKATAQGIWKECEAGFLDSLLFEQMGTYRLLHFFRRLVVREVGMLIAGHREIEPPFRLLTGECGKRKFYVSHACEEEIAGLLVRGTVAQLKSWKIGTYEGNYLFSKQKKIHAKTGSFYVTARQA